MILLKRLNGSEFAVNADLIERIDVTPDTVVTLVDGTKYVVNDSIDDIVDRIVSFRARILATVDGFDGDDSDAVVSPLRLVAEIVED
ncbi:MAG: flagellar FlbD family protein [Acidimicrobiia bacterium]